MITEQGIKWTREAHEKALEQSVSNLTQYLRTVPAVEIDSLKRDSNFLSQIGQCESALKAIRKIMSRG